MRTSAVRSDGGRDAVGLLVLNATERRTLERAAKILTEMESRCLDANPGWKETGGFGAKLRDARPPIESLARRGAMSIAGAVL